jgi:hypothetical protein
MRNSFSSASGGNQEGSSNGMIQSIVPLSRTRAGGSNLLNHPRISSLPPTNHSNMQFEINMMMGNMTDSNLYIPDAAGDNTGLSFRFAYNAAKKYKNSNTKELSVCVGSMLCSVVPAFRNNVEAALNGIGIRPRFVSLPSQAIQNGIVISEVPALDWSSILVIFGYMFGKYKKLVYSLCLIAYKLKDLFGNNVLIHPKSYSVKLILTFEYLSFLTRAAKSSSCFPLSCYI